MWKNADIPNRKSYIFWYSLICLYAFAYTKHLYHARATEETKPPKTQIMDEHTCKWTQITYVALYKHEDHFQCRPIYSCPSTSNLMYYNTKVLLSRNRQMYPPTSVVQQLYLAHFILLAVVEVGHELAWEMSPLEHWAIYVDCPVLFLLLLLFRLVVVLHLSLWIHNYRWITTTTTTKLHSNKNKKTNHQNKKIDQLM